MLSQLLSSESSSLPDLRRDTEELDLILEQLHICQKRGFSVPSPSECPSSGLNGESVKNSFDERSNEEITRALSNLEPLDSKRLEDDNILNPVGYTKLYEKDSGYVVYYDPSNEILWQTATDPKSGKLYFFDAKGGKSLWRLPYRGKTGSHHRISKIFDKDFGSPIVDGPLLTFPDGLKRNCHVVCTSEGHLLLFNDKKDFKSFFLCEESPAETDICDSRKRSSPLKAFDLRSWKLDWSSSSVSTPVSTKWYALGKTLYEFRLIPLDSEDESHALSFKCKRHSEFKAWIKAFLSVGSGVSPAEEDESNPRNVLHPRGGSKKLARYKSFREKTNPIEPEFDKGKEKQKSPFSRHRQISQSFNLKGMSVQLRKKKPPSPTSANSLSPFGESSSRSESSAKGILARAPSRRRLILSRFFDKDGRKQKTELEESGILLKEAVFGNDLEHVASVPDPEFRNGEVELPEFVVRAVKRIENEFVQKEGLYRVNGYDVTVQKIRLDVDQNDYRSFEFTKEFAVITSSLKLYLRELPEQLIPEDKKNDFFEAISSRVHSTPDTEDSPVLEKLKFAVSNLEPRAQILLEYILRHLHFVASYEKDNKMGYSNLATVFGPNLIHSSSSAKRRPESLICENELCNYICERLIMGYKFIFNAHED